MLPEERACAVQDLVWQRWLEFWRRVSAELEPVLARLWGRRAELGSASALAVSPELPWIAGAAAMLALLPVLSPVVRRAQAPGEPRVLASETV